jgi:hypothetical protein
MRFISGSITVSTSDTPVALSTHSDLNTSDKIMWASFAAREANTGAMYIGQSTVDKDNDGYQLPTGESGRQVTPHIIHPGVIPSSSKKFSTVQVSTIYFDTDNSGDLVDFSLLVE